MVQTVIHADQLQGYVPVLDARRLAKPSIITGVNFLNDVDGPISAFGTNYLNYVKFSSANRLRVTELRVNEELWYGTPTGLYRFDKVSGELLSMLPANNLTVTNQFWPWSVALVGGRYYFAQYAIGLFQYDPITNTMTTVATPGNIQVKFICASYGRLVALCINDPSDLVIWSALDDGTDLTPSLTTSAGFQTVGLTGRTGYRVDPVSTGFIVSTNSGIMIGTYTGLNYLWAFRTLSTNVKLFTPNAGCILPDQGVLLMDRSGMYLTDGGTPEPWEPLMGEFFKNNQLQGLTSAFPGCVELQYSQAMRAVFVAFSPTSRQGNTETTFVFLTAAQEWGVCNKSAWSFVDMISPLNGIEYAGYVAEDGYFQYFDGQYNCAIAPIDGRTFSDLIWRPVVQQTVLTQDGVVYGSSNITFRDRLITDYASFSVMGLYYFDQLTLDDADPSTFNTDPPVDPTANPVTGENTIIFYPEGGVQAQARQYVPPTIGLNSFIDVGPVRFEEQQSADETSAVSGLIVGCNSVSGISLFEDWNLLSGNEDYGADAESIDDWGANAGIPDNFNLYLNSTNDGTNPGLQGLELLSPVSNMGGSLFYSPMGYSSIYQRFRLSATQPNQGFALKFLDVSGLLTGRMTFNG